MHKSRYVVMNQNGGWQIRNVYRHVTSIFLSKAQALCAAIELAEKDGERVMHRRFLSGMRMIASSPSGCMETICIRMTRRDQPARNSRDAVAPRVARLGIAGITADSRARSDLVWDSES
jgi:hypothetical protein